MRTLELPPGGATTSVLGFGCSALVAGRTTKEAVELLEVAFDAGIRHYDLARVYGTGDAEAVVGRFAASRRSELTIASKFGIEPMRATPTMGMAKRGLRFAFRRSGRLLQFARRYSSRTVTRGIFTPEKARSSLEVSLRQLGADHLDAFLLHDCTAEDWEQPDLQEALASLRAEGRIRSYGPATHFPQVAAIQAGARPAPVVAQFEADVLSPNALRLAGERRPAIVVTHGCFREAQGFLAEHLMGDEPRIRAWSAALGADMSSRAEVSGLLLCSALASNPGGIVLFSSGDPDKIRRNAALAAAPPYDEGQLDAFGGLVRNLRDEVARNGAPTP